MTPQELCEEATRRGLRLEMRGDKLAVFPANRLQPDFAEKLRQHKDEILFWMETQNSELSPDCLNWLHTAKQILAGEFNGADRSAVDSLAIGLRSIPHPICRRALARLKL